MTEAKFEIVADQPRKLLRITWAGHWDVATVAAYKEGLMAAIARMRASGIKQGEIIALVDARKLGPQSQDVTEAYTKSFTDPALRPRRLATVLSSALFRMQVQRLAVADQRIFEDQDEAMAWLVE